MSNVHMFIIPNKCSKVDFSSDDDIVKFNNGGILRVNEQYKNLGADTKFQFIDGDTPIQVWITDDRKDNWQSHGLPHDLCKECAGDDQYDEYAPSYIPARLLKGMKEGDTIDISFNGTTVTVTACQLDYRYRSFGSFEEVVAKMS